MSLQKIFLALGLFLLGFTAYGRVALPSLFQNGMVLQQNTFVSIWGNASAGELIEVQGSWDSISTTTYADSKGKWLVQIATPGAGGPHELSISGENQMNIQDIWIGEVWIASGQSNMEWPLSRSEGGTEEASNADFPKIRFFKVERELSSTPRLNCKGRWQVCTPEEIGNYSAVAYHFAKRLHEELQVPIGIIQTAWGGTPAEAWTPREALETGQTLKPLVRKFDEALSRHREFPSQYPNPVHQKSPGILYNGMLSPLIPFAIRGAIWYQGESNTRDPYQYRELFPAMVQSWRRKWSQHFSFYFVQIAPFAYKTPLSGTGLREAQLMSRSIERSGMVSTLDIGNPIDIHPRKKKEVGERLALHALSKDYGASDMIVEGPVLEKVSRKFDELILEFSSVGTGLRMNPSIPNFEVAGNDKVFYPAEVRVEKSTIAVKSSKVFQPISCRYAWSDTAVASLFNSAGLPASSFRTDDWPIFFGDLVIHPTYSKTAQNFQVKLAYQGSEEHDIYYSLSGSKPNFKSEKYEGPFLVQAPAIIQSSAGQGEFMGSKVAKTPLFRSFALFFAKIISQTPPSKSYPGNEAQGLINGIGASTNYLHPEWMGYDQDEVEAVLDFGSKRRFEEVSLNFLVHPMRNIHLPARIELYTSSNGRKFKLLEEINLENKTLKDKYQVDVYTQHIDISQTDFRYLKLKAVNRSVLLDLDGVEKKSWLFLDEIQVK